MIDLRLRRYSKEDKTIWDEFVKISKNGTFLLQRDYMDYHADRFIDHSILIYRGEKLFALLPASEKDGILNSHGGLTYGGLILNRKAGTKEVMEIMRMLCEYAASEGLSELIYKPVPHIYHEIPSEEDLYALFRLNATLSVRNVSCTILQSDRIKFRDIRKSGIRKAKLKGISIEESYNFEGFWQILNNNLQERYNARPVHTVEEILSLKNKFPHNIRLFTASVDNRMLAGVVIYLDRGVAHTQYISASPEGKETGALDLLFDRLINDIFASCQYFDFGTSNEDGGRYLNESLIYQKEGFGGRAICYDTYRICI